MPIRTVKQHTDRGKIKDLVVASEIAAESQDQPSPSELRMKKLFEYAQLTKNQKLLDALGFITTDYISDKNALPLSVYRIRQMVTDIKSKSSGNIDLLSQQFSGFMGDELSPETVDYLNKKRARVKTASVRKAPIFWRARRS